MNSDLSSENNKLYQEIFTSIGSEEASRKRLQITARVRLVIIFPLILLFAFISTGFFKEQSSEPQVYNIVLILWLFLSLAYITANLLINNFSYRSELVKLLTYSSIVIELTANQTVLYMAGTLTSYSTMFIVVSVALYRVFLNYGYALAAALTGAGLFVLTSILELTGTGIFFPAFGHAAGVSVYNHLLAGICSIIAVLSGIFIAFTSINYGMNQVEKLHRQLVENSVVDVLTNIANRRYFEKHLDAEWRRARRNNTPLSLIMVDVDNFKLYNDNYGHLKGDICLRMIAQALQSGIKRPTDLVARYGGEEFAILLPETELEGAAILAENLRQQIINLAVPHAYSTVNNTVTISLGVATVIPHHTLPNILVERADKALYRAKRNGRNRVALDYAYSNKTTQY